MYLGSDYGVLRSSDGHTWTKIPGSPKATALIGDGENLFAAFQNDFFGHPYYTSKENDAATWQNVATPTIPQGASGLSYDRDHHILYAPSWRGGLFRVVTR
jgi:hypothetical protein